ncbi:Ger(x)C family spore germination protein [Paenibacillus sp. Marseille-Q4541]|uniref:Ger(x)C family spore germination protein n=1 Tax=Paenibacillus sp. Marseille-Q4541 TaxID=2831522 RepID=UPI001BAB632B|nr:Ger(x)C family spore germination protein [Paenibacillus sp. Marseille-Q4541]
MRISILKIGIMLLILLSTTGCWSKVELDELVFVNGLYVDVGEEPDTIEVTISTPLPNRLVSGQSSGGSSGGSDKPYFNLSKTSTSIGKALEMLQKDLPRQLNLSEIKVVMIGEKYGQKGMGDLLEWAKREPSVPVGTYVVAASGKAKDAAQLTPIFEQFPIKVLMSFVEHRLMFDTTIRDFLISEAADMGVAVTHLNYESIDSAFSGSNKETWIGIQGAAMFQNDKLKGVLGTDQAKALAWADGYIKTPIYSVKWDDGKSNADLRFTRAMGKSTVKMTNKGPVFTIHLKGRASLISKKDEMNRSTQDVTKVILTEVQKTIEDDFRNGIQTSQKEGADVLGLGLLLEWNYPSFWRNIQDRWLDYYKNEAKINVITDIKMNDYGKEN